MVLNVLIKNENPNIWDTGGEKVKASSAASFKWHLNEWLVDMVEDALHNENLCMI